SSPCPPLNSFRGGVIFGGVNDVVTRDRRDMGRDRAPQGGADRPAVARYDYSREAASARARRAGQESDDQRAASPRLSDGKIRGHPQLGRIMRRKQEEIDVEDRPRV